MARHALARSLRSQVGQQRPGPRSLSQDHVPHARAGEGGVRGHAEQERSVEEQAMAFTYHRDGTRFIWGCWKDAFGNEHRASMETENEKGAKAVVDDLE